MFNQSKTYQSQRKEIKEGRTSDFINLMLNAQIDESEKISSTKGMTLDEMIAQVNISRAFGHPPSHALNCLKAIVYNRQFIYFQFIFSFLYSSSQVMKQLQIQ